MTLSEAPIGTRAPAIGGGAWYKTKHGWQWNGRHGTFPTPGGDWNGTLIPPKYATQQEGKRMSKMQFNECRTCGAKDGRAGLLISDECQNCYDTRRHGKVMIHSYLVRADNELRKTMDIV